MADSMTTYQIWAPDDALWTAWAKPVLFANPPAGYPASSLEIPTLPHTTPFDRHTAFVVDLPYKQSVLEGLALARQGYRPVPLYNGVRGPRQGAMLVPVLDIVFALFKGAEELEKCQLPPDAPPAFLLDANRMKGKSKQIGKFDNRWCVFPQDMPSATYLVKNGIEKVVVRTDEIANDLAHILCRYQEKGIKLLQWKRSAMREVNISRPSRFKSLLYRYQTMSGLTRNAAGGFGAAIPEAVQSSSGGRYYGMG